MSEEQRKHERRVVRWRAALILGTKGESVIKGEVLDISPAGICFLSDRALPTRQRVKIAIQVPPGRAGPNPQEARVEATITYSLFSSDTFKSGLQITQFVAGKAAFIANCY